MNTYVKTIVADGIQVNRRVSEVFSWTSLLVPILSFSCLLSAFALIYSKDLNRRLFIELQQAQKIEAQYTVDYSKLLLEESTWSNQSRVQRIASDQLGMVPPKSTDVVVISN